MGRIAPAHRVSTVQTFIESSRLCLAVAMVPALLGGLAACEEEGPAPHTMLFEIEAGLSLPSAQTALSEDGARLTITTDMDMGGMAMDMSAGFEPLDHGAAYYAWVQGDGASWSPVGKFVPGTDLVADVAAPGRAMVTLETEDAPAAPSGVVVVEGAAGGTLAFGDLVPASFINAHVEATIDGDALDLVFHELPALPEGYFYGLWCVPVNGDGAEDGDPVSLGAIGPPEAAAFSAAGVTWPASYALTLSIEAEEGVVGRSSLIVLTAGHAKAGSTGGHQH